MEIHFGGTISSHTEVLLFISLQSTNFSIYLFPAKQGLQTSHGQTLFLLPTRPAVPPRHKAAQAQALQLPQPRVTEYSDFKTVAVTSFVGQY